MGVLILFCRVFTCRLRIKSYGIVYFIYILPQLRTYVAFVGDLNARYLECVNGYTQIRKADYFVSFITHNTLNAIDKTFVLVSGTHLNLQRLH